MTLCGWEGNRRSGVALAMRHRLSGLSTYGLNGRCLGDEHLAYAPLGYGPFTYFTTELRKLTINHTINGYNFLTINQILIVKFSIKITSLTINYKIDKSEAFVK